jgi:tRNA/rRNA methyltransferase
MSNMGSERLILIDRQCELDYSAQQAAATGQFALQNRIEYPSWADFYKNEANGIRIALTARDGRAKAVYDFRTTLEKVKNLDQAQNQNLSQIYLIFGPEDCGLSLDDVKNCHYSCSLPTYGENWSLNLSQAVLLALFILRDSWGGTRTTLDGQIRPRELKLNESVKQANLLPDNTLRTWLETLGFDLSKKRINVYTILRRMFLHNVPTSQELRILETVLQQNIRRLKEAKNVVALGQNTNLFSEDLIAEQELLNQQLEDFDTPTAHHQ